MKKKIISLFLCISMLSGVLLGCSSSDNKNTETTQTEDSTQDISTENISTEMSTEIVSTEFTETEVVEKEPEKQLYTITSSDLLAKAREFFIAQAKAVVNSRYPGYKTPDSATNMLSHGLGLPNFTHDWDEVNFRGLPNSCGILSGGLAHIKNGQSLSFNIKCTSATNNMPSGGFRHYWATDAEIGMIVKLEVSSSVEHDSSRSKENEGYIGMIFTCCSDNNWEIAGIYEADQYKDYSDFDWGEYQLVDENKQVAMDDFNNSNVLDYFKSYITYLEENYAEEDIEGYHYNLVDLNADGIYELNVSYSSANSFVLSYYNNEIILNRIEHGGIDFKSEENKILMSGGNQGDYYDTLCHLENGEFVTDVAGEWYEVVLEDGSGIKFEYKVNGVVVTEEEYNQYFEIDYDEWSGFQDAYSLAEIINSMKRISENQ